MDKITRLLLLYSKLTKGKKINKTIFCLENDCSPRTFDRDIEDVRLHLSEIFSANELKYDRSSNDYFIEGAEKKRLEATEYLLIEQILKDSEVLRKDEFDILMVHLLDNTEKSKSLENERKAISERYKTPLHGKALLKMHGDLISVIRTKKGIRIKYFKNNGEEVKRKVIPCEIKYYLGYLYLIAYRAEEADTYPAYYRLDRIDSFEILNEQNIKEQKRVKDYMDKYSDGIVSMYGGDYITVKIQCRNDFISYVFDMFRDVKIITQDGEEAALEIKAFEGGFIKWLMSQSADNIRVISPVSTIEKIKEEAKNIMIKYGGMN